MKLYLCAALALSVALPVFAVEDVASVAEGLRIVVVGYA